MRRLLVMVGVAAMGAFLLSGAAIAGAQTAPTTTTTTIPFTCDFTTTPTTLGVGGGSISVAGTAPADTDVHITVQNSTDGTQTKTAHSSVSGNWGPVTFNVTSSATITVTLAPFYPATTCVGPSVSVEAAAAALPRTGSNDTKPFVLIGAAAVLVGLVLVVAARRRDHTRGRA